VNAVRKFLSNPSEQKTLEELIRIFATTFLEPFIKKGSGQRLMELMMRERYDPHLPPHMFVEEIIRPVKTIMKEALSQILPELTDTAAELCIHSIVGQLFHIMQAQELFKGMDKTDIPILDMPKAIEHTVKFSAGGIRQYVKKKIE
ncbi:CerR family C-terminal domain-containing protein, partial [Candidatus Babeliales bacterium]|nr:CerR family C-terminal domain-containing protein [Candidatus Babeliales bacterium]